MSTSIPGPFGRRLRFTPLRDLLRGRVSGRLDWRGRIAASGLPEALNDHVFAVVKRTKLWRGERAAVAGELIAHFHDGLAAGETADTLIADFGDTKTAAKLIRRAKRRQRPVVWHVAKWLCRGLLILSVIYGYFLVNFLVRRPVVSVDYLAKLNARTLAVPEAERAWPVYRRAMVALGTAHGQEDKTLERWIEGFKNERTVLDATPADAEWRTLTGWLDTHRDGLRLLREAAGRKTYGFVLGPNGSQNDLEVGLNRQSGDVPVLEVLLPDLQQTRRLARLLLADTRYAVTQSDGARVVADIDAVLGMADQLAGRPFIVNGLVRAGVYAMAFERLETTLAESPGVFSDAQLIALAHRIAAVGGNTADSLIDTAGERIVFHDLVQRMYSDDGHGDGRLTWQGMNKLPTSGLLGYPMDDTHPVDHGVQTAVTGAASILGSRRDAVAEYDRLMGLIDRTFSKPLRDWPAGESPLVAYDRRYQEIDSTPLLAARYLLVKVMLPSVQAVGSTAEKVIGQRDGLTVGLALELYRRRHGNYPATLDALVPKLLPAVPLDRIDGKPLRYRLIGSRPVVYSVGVDRDDDAGRPPLDQKGHPQPWMAAQWPTGTVGRVSPKRLAAMGVQTDGTLPDGDWPVYDARPKPAPATRPAE